MRPGLTCSTALGSMASAISACRHYNQVLLRKGEGTVKYIEALANYERRPGEKSVFLAGGITGCPNWQQEMVTLLGDSELTLLNPRREHFPIGDPQAALQQIMWEYTHLRKADGILFWFPPETICPIVLYELGAWSMMKKPIFIGVHPDYQRRRDVTIQTFLARSEVKPVDSLAELTAQVLEWARH